ncbi:MAG: hypothetical protein D6696_05580 [Acidobacteria bacterium]|nr:MAG: hypothetical protein D6696_05580 [Acidobacteriota bacterium]
MDNQSRVFFVSLTIVVLLVILLWFQPAIEEGLAPEPQRAWVAIETATEPARVGPVTMAAGTPFTLRAVLEARGRGGRPIYYTEARSLHFAGREAPVPEASIRTWDRVPRVKVRWFTVEGPQPFLELADEAALEAFEMQLFFRPDWPDAWSVPGVVEAAMDDHLDLDERDALGVVQRFGTQRYHARIELYPSDESVLPMSRYSSWGPQQLPQETARFPTVVATLPGALAPVSRVFGLSQLEPPLGAPASLLARLRRLADQGLAFSRLTVLRDQLRYAGLAPDTASWRPIDLGGDNRWGQEAAAGDLLRVGERVVVLFEDRGTAGVLDYQDLCFDFVRGAAIRTLDEVFSGEGLVVEHLPIAERPDSR